MGDAHPSCFPRNNSSQKTSAKRSFSTYFQQFRVSWLHRDRGSRDRKNGGCRVAGRQRQNSLAWGACTKGLQQRQVYQAVPPVEAKLQELGSKLADSRRLSQADSQAAEIRRRTSEIGREWALKAKTQELGSVVKRQRQARSPHKSSSEELSNLKGQGDLETGLLNVNTDQ